MKSESDVRLRILRAVAQRERCGMTDLEPLHGTVDPGALGELAASEAVQGIEFTYHGYEIRINSDGHVQITAVA